jgi:peroxiredoxin
MAHSDLKPSMSAPPLSLTLATGEPWSLSATTPKALDLIAFYRGDFCPYCRDFIRSLEARAPQFQGRGIDLTAVSMDSPELARKSVTDWDLSAVKVACGLSLEMARAWRIFVTTRQAETSLVTFNEPALVFVAPDKTIYAMMLQSIPCGRPDLDNLLGGIDFLAEHGYPTRGAH